MHVFCFSVASKCNIYSISEIQSDHVIAVLLLLLYEHGIMNWNLASDFFHYIQNLALFSRLNYSEFSCTIIRGIFIKVAEM